MNIIVYTLYNSQVVDDLRKFHSDALFQNLSFQMNIYMYNTPLKIMNIYENYNTATQKYGKSIVKDFTRFGIPDKYLLAACRFAKDTNKSLKEITSLFKDWNKYVRRFSNVDVNRLSYNDDCR